MSTTTSQIRDGLKEAIERIPDLTAARTWPGQISPPTALIRVSGIDYAEDFGGLNIFHVEIVLAVRFADLASSHDELDEYVDPSGDRSISTAVEVDQSMSGICEIVNVMRMHDYGDLLIGDAKYLGAIFDVDVYAN